MNQFVKQKQKKTLKRFEKSRYFSFNQQTKFVNNSFRFIKIKCSQINHINFWNRSQQYSSFFIYINCMQQYLLNDKVIRQVHMKSVDLKQRTKYAKKYDMPFAKPVQVYTQRNLIQNLLQKQRKILTKPRSDDFVAQNSPKTKHLLSTLRAGGLFLTTEQGNSENKIFIKESCFKIKGIKKSLTDLCSAQKSMNRTCSLVAGHRFTEFQVPPYDFSSDLRFKRSPRCFISPKSKVSLKEDQCKFHSLNENKQNMSPEQKSRYQNKHISKKYSSKSKKNSYKDGQTNNNMTIKQMVDKQIQEQIKKRRALCRTAPTKHIDKLNGRQQLSMDGLGQEDICKVEAKIYSQMRENRQKAQRRNKQRIGINITKNKPFTSSQINKNTVKLLKKYHCDNMQGVKMKRDVSGVYLTWSQVQQGLAILNNIWKDWIIEEKVSQRFEFMVSRQEHTS